MSMSKNLALIGVCIMAVTLAQLLLKVGMNRTGPVEQFDLATFTRVLRDAYVGLAIVAYGACGFIWMAVLSRVPLNFASPLLTLSTVTVAVISTLVLNEPFTWSRFIGTLLTAGGAWLIIRSY
jgi:uncharacterized membrane protein